MTTPNAIDLIATQILFDAKAALASLKSFSEGVDSASARVAVLKSLIQSTALQMGGDLKKAEGAVGAFANSLTGIKPAEVKQAGMEVRQLGNRFEETAKKSKYSIDVIRTALGVLTAMLVNVVLSAIVNFAKQAVKAFTDVEEALWRIHTAEVALSKQGVEVSMQGLVEGVQKAKEELKIFSEADLLASMSTFAAGMAQFGFSEEQIINLTRYAAVLNVVSQTTESLQSTTDKMMTAAISSQSRSIASVNVQFGELAMQLKGVELGYLKTGEAAKNLTINERAQVKYAIMEDQALASLDEYAQYLDTGSAKLKENAAGWEDVKTAFGGFMVAIAPGLTGLLDLLTGIINAWKTFGAIWVATIDGIIYSLGSFIEKVADGKNQLVALFEVLTKFPTAWRTIFNFEIRSLFNGVPGDAPEWFKKLVGGALDTPETPTIDIPFEIDGPGEEETAAFEKLAEDLAEIAEKAQDAYHELTILTEQKYQDIVIDAEIKLEDIELEFAQKIEDAERELQQAIDDIHLEARQAEEDAIRQAHEDQLRAEAEFQQKMKELKQRFLMDLEEALHARDARQVLRLIKQYEFDKQQAIEQKALDDKLRQERLQADLEAIRIEEQRKIEAEQREFAREMQELEIEKQREIEAANEAERRKLEDLILWNQREAEEIARHTAEKMAKLEEAYIQEFGIHGFYQDEITKLIAGYTAANIAAIDAMYAHMAGVYAGIQEMYVNSVAMLNNLGATTGQTAYPSPPGGYAEGGSVIAMRPTRALFGERGPELATFTPLGREGKDINKLFGNMPSSSGSGGRMLIEMLLSPDLEARVIENSLSRTADIVARVSRSK